MPNTHQNQEDEATAYHTSKSTNQGQGSTVTQNPTEYTKLLSGTALVDEEATDTATALPNATRSCDYRIPIRQVKWINEFFLSNERNFLCIQSVI
jgi:hypothetical protein